METVVNGGSMVCSVHKVGCLVMGLVAGVIAYTPPSAAVSALAGYRGYAELTAAAGSMDLDTYTLNMISWQMDHGGFCKAYADMYKSAWNKTTEKCSWTNGGKPLGTFDNNATIQEMRLLATRYQATSSATNKVAFKSAFEKAVGFVLESQTKNGGWPQVYPARGNYSDMATYNDNAMVRVMVLVQDMVNGVAPFQGDLLYATQIGQLSTALDKSVDFALQAQIINGGERTVWCAQHDPLTYAPVGARSYELPSKSGSESAGIVWFLMNWPCRMLRCRAQ